MQNYLYLSLYRKWFDLIACGEKKFEYRKDNQFWQKRILNRGYNCIFFRNGYGKSRPYMIVEYLGFEYQEINGEQFFALKLGEIKELNYQESLA